MNVGVKPQVEQTLVSDAGETGVMISSRDCKRAGEPWRDAGAPNKLEGSGHEYSGPSAPGVMHDMLESKSCVRETGFETDV